LEVRFKSNLKKSVEGVGREGTLTECPVHSLKHPRTPDLFELGLPVFG